MDGFQYGGGCNAGLSGRRRCGDNWHNLHRGNRRPNILGQRRRGLCWKQVKERDVLCCQDPVHARQAEGALSFEEIGYVGVAETSGASEVCP